jgi:hypothetical protein
MIQFGFDKDGNLQLVIAKELWGILKEMALKEAASEQHNYNAVSGHTEEELAAVELAAVPVGNFVKLDLSAMAGAQFLTFSFTPEPDSPPCPPLT